MATYDLGDVITLRCEVRDADGALADAGAVTCTITLPDGTTDTPAVDHEADSGIYTADYTPGAAGYFAVRWLATGVNAGAFLSSFTVTSGPALITVEDLAGHMRQTFPSDEERAAAVLACTQGQSAVLSHLRRPDLDKIPGYARDAILLVMLRQATSIYRTPGSERTSFSDGEVSVGLNPRILTPDEKSLLRDWRRRKRHGTIMLSAPATPDEGGPA